MDFRLNLIMITLLVVVAYSMADISKEQPQKSADSGSDELLESAESSWYKTPNAAHNYGGGGGHHGGGGGGGHGHGGGGHGHGGGGHGHGGGGHGHGGGGHGHGHGHGRGY